VIRTQVIDSLVLVLAVILNPRVERDAVCEEHGTWGMPVKSNLAAAVIPAVRDNDK
jgi:hypothetical protein